jgi:hypothetical protein
MGPDVRPNWLGIMRLTIVFVADDLFNPANKTPPQMNKQKLRDR